MLEKEIKLMLSEEEYLRLKNGLRFDGEAVQTNHYYYSAECSQRRISVRVREIDGKALLQIKLPVSTEGSLAVREELERELPSVPETVGQELLSEICGVDGEARRIGALSTLRLLSHQIENVELCLDRNEYLGITDYELEAEYTGEYPEEAIALIASFGIDTDRPAEGKYSRFLKALKAQK
ncbi:MAG: CYTH domain-containing protein [Ruminococcus sp.]|nr:CYTH domain-containing protein [Ruminococcus sp.]